MSPLIFIIAIGGIAAVSVYAFRKDLFIKQPWLQAVAVITVIASCTGLFVSLTTDATGSPDGVDTPEERSEPVFKPDDAPEQGPETPTNPTEPIDAYIDGQIELAAGTWRIRTTEGPGGTVTAAQIIVHERFSGDTNEADTNDVPVAKTQTTFDLTVDANGVWTAAADDLPSIWTGDLVVTLSSGETRALSIFSEAFTTP